MDSSGNVVSSSSYKVTKIDSKSGTISLDIPDEITVGDSYSLPSSYSFEEVISGGSASCSVNGNVIENTSSLEVGTYNIECISKTNAGIEVNINKNLKVVEKKGEESNEEEKNTPSSEATEPDETTDENKVEETEGE